MSALDWMWQHVMPVLAPMVGLAVLWAAVRTRAEELPSPRRYWLFLFVLLMWTGDAVLGDARPLPERFGKGSLAVLVWISLAVVVWRRRRQPRSRPTAADARSP